MNIPPGPPPHYGVQSSNFPKAEVTGDSTDLGTLEYDRATMQLDGGTIPQQFVLRLLGRAYGWKVSLAEIQPGGEYHAQATELLQTIEGTRVSLLDENGNPALKPVWSTPNSPPPILLLEATMTLTVKIGNDEYFMKFPWNGVELTGNQAEDIELMKPENAENLERAMQASAYRALQVYGSGADAIQRYFSQDPGDANAMAQRVMGLVQTGKAFTVTTTSKGEPAEHRWTHQVTGPNGNILHQYKSVVSRGERWVKVIRHAENGLDFKASGKKLNADYTEYATLGSPEYQRLQQLKELAKRVPSRAGETAEARTQDLRADMREQLGEKWHQGSRDLAVQLLEDFDRLQIGNFLNQYGIFFHDADPQIDEATKGDFEALARCFEAEDALSSRTNSKFVIGAISNIETEADLLSIGADHPLWKLAERKVASHQARAAEADDLEDRDTEFSDELSRVRTDFKEALQAYDDAAKGDDEEAIQTTKANVLAFLPQAAQGKENTLINEMRQHLRAADERPLRLAAVAEQHPIEKDAAAIKLVGGIRGMQASKPEGYEGTLRAYLADVKEWKTRHEKLSKDALLTLKVDGGEEEPPMTVLAGRLEQGSRSKSLAALGAMLPLIEHLPEDLAHKLEKGVAAAELKTDLFGDDDEADDHGRLPELVDAAVNEELDQARRAIAERVIADYEAKEDLRDSPYFMEIAWDPLPLNADGKVNKEDPNYERKLLRYKVGYLELEGAEALAKDLEGWRPGQDAPARATEAQQIAIGTVNGRLDAYNKFKAAMGRILAEEPGWQPFDDIEEGHQLQADMVLINNFFNNYIIAAPQDQLLGPEDYELLARDANTQLYETIERLQDSDASERDRKKLAKGFREGVVHNIARTLTSDRAAQAALVSALKPEGRLLNKRDRVVEQIMLQFRPPLILVEAPPHPFQGEPPRWAPPQ